VDDDVDEALAVVAQGVLHAVLLPDRSHGKQAEELAEWLGFEHLVGPLDALGEQNERQQRCFGSRAAGSLGVTFHDLVLLAVLFGCHPPGRNPAVAVLAGQAQHAGAVPGDPDSGFAAAFGFEWQAHAPGRIVGHGAGIEQ